MGRRILTRRILSVVVALVATMAGHALVWYGGSVVTRQAQTFGAAQGHAALALLGALLVGVSLLTVVWSSLGALTLGVIDLVVGLLGVLAPSVLSPRFLYLMGPELGAGAVATVPTGVTLMTGAISLAGGLAVWHLRRPHLVSRIVVPIADVVLSPVAFGVLTVGVGATVLRLERADAGVNLLAIVAAVLFAAIAASVHWSSLGAIVVGAVGFLLGLVLIFALDGLYRVGVVPSDFSLGLQSLAGYGTGAMLGAALAGLGGGAGLARRRVAVAGQAV